jgi:hypothetical protein
MIIAFVVYVVAGRGSPSDHPVLDRIGNFLADIRRLQVLPAQNVFGLFGQLENSRQKIMARPPSSKSRQFYPLPAGLC